jgi:DNA-binding transcriptional MerR regulator
MRIGELASTSGVSARALRYYEERGLLPSRRQDNGYREYDESAVPRVHNIRMLLDAGLSAENIRDLNSCLDEDFDLVPSCMQAVSLYEQRLEVVRRQRAALVALESRLENELHRLRTHDRAAGGARTDQSASGPDVCGP